MLTLTIAANFGIFCVGLSLTYWTVLIRFSSTNLFLPLPESPCTELLSPEKKLPFVDKSLLVSFIPVLTSISHCTSLSWRCFERNTKCYEFSLLCQAIWHHVLMSFLKRAHRIKITISLLKLQIHWWESVISLIYISYPSQYIPFGNKITTMFKEIIN